VHSEQHHIVWCYARRRFLPRTYSTPRYARCSRSVTHTHLKLLSEEVNARTDGAVRGSPAQSSPDYSLKLINRFDGEFVTTAEASACRHFRGSEVQTIARKATVSAGCHFGMEMRLAALIGMPLMVTGDNDLQTATGKAVPRLLHLHDAQAKANAQAAKELFREMPSGLHLFARLPQSGRRRDKYSGHEQPTSCLRPPLACRPRRGGDRSYDLRDLGGGGGGVAGGGGGGVAGGAPDQSAK